MFSATLTEEVAALIDNYFYEPVTVEIENQRTPLEQITQYFYSVPNFFTKVNLLEHLLANQEQFSRVLIFVSIKQFADKVFELLDPIFPEQIGVLHSNKSQNLRINSLEKFRNGTFRMLIATDVPGAWIFRIFRTLSILMCPIFRKIIFTALAAPDDRKRPELQ